MATRLEARIRYFVNDFWVHPTSLGHTFSTQYDGSEVLVRLPTARDDFTAKPHEQELIPTPSWYEVNTMTEPGWDNRTVAVGLISVTVALERDLSTTRPEDPFEGEYGLMVVPALESGIAVAETAAHDFMRWVRAMSRQPWLGLVAEPPRQYGRAGLYYADTQEGILGLGPEQSVTIRSSRLRLEDDDLERVRDGLSGRKDVPVWQALLADARHLDAGRYRPDIERSFVTAAIACEVRAQAHLREHVSADRATLTKMLMDRVSSLPYLLDEVFEAAVGTSLKKDNASLYAMVARLNKVRNRIVHEGIYEESEFPSSSPPEVATQRFDWLDSLPGASPS